MSGKDDNPDIEKMNEEELKAYVTENFYKVRPCTDYYTEFLECSSLGMKFHNWFVDGELGDCSVWKEDFNNCNKSYEDHKAFAKIIKHENERLEKRIKNHGANNIWEKRTSPPPNWNTELPDFLLKKQSDAYKNFEEEKSCVIF